MAEKRGLKYQSITKLFEILCDDCKKQVKEEQFPAVNEICSMMDSFKLFCKSHLYQNSKKYPSNDNTNRHGILHGAFSDQDYGRPLNFYKCMAAVEFLCWISAFESNVSWLLPGSSKDSQALGTYYESLVRLSKVKRKFS